MCTFYTSFLLMPLLENVVKLTMYKKLHTPEKEPSAEPFCDKGSFLWSVPEEVLCKLMLYIVFIGKRWYMNFKMLSIKLWLKGCENYMLWNVISLFLARISPLLELIDTIALIWIAILLSNKKKWERILLNSKYVLCFCGWNEHYVN